MSDDVHSAKEHHNMLRRMSIEGRLGMQAQMQGRDANALVECLRALPLDVLEAYLAADYRIEIDGTSYTLNIGKTMADLLTKELVRKEVASIAIITAWNPYSMELRPEENSRRQEALRALLDLRGEIWLEACGGSRDQQWQEPSVAVANLAYDEAQAIGLAFQQNAVVFCATGDYAELLPCLPQRLIEL